MKSIKVAICQNLPIYDKEKNIRHAIEMIKEAADKGAELVVLPEIFFYPYDIKKLPEIADRDGETIGRLSSVAKEKQIHICTGSIAEELDSKIYNSSSLLNDRGEILDRYSKCHMFDVELGKVNVKESETFSKGEKLSVLDAKFGKIGVLICYDIRFPEATRKLALFGAEIILVPAAFNNVTGPAHWHTVFRARAIENQVFMVVASPACNQDVGYKAYGHSMIVDPWGEVLAEADIDETIIYHTLDPDRLKDVRERLPLLKHRRPELY